MAVCRALHLLAWAAGLLSLAPRTCQALLLEPAGRVTDVEVGGAGQRGPSHKLSPAFPVCFIHVGKCAGGTLSRIFHKIQAASGTPEWDFLEIHTHNGFHGPDVPHPKIQEDCLSRPKIVLWVRDPMERLMASWRNELQKFYGMHIKEFMLRYPDLFPGAPPASRVNESAAWPAEMLDLNYVARVVQGRGRGRITDEDFLSSFKHGTMGLSWYVGLNAIDLEGVPNQNIFVGRVEHMEEDWERFLKLLKVPMREDTRLGQGQEGHIEHETQKQEMPLSNDAASLLRRVAKPEYAAIEKLVSRGLLNKDYLTEVRKTKYVMRKAGDGSS